MTAIAPPVHARSALLPLAVAAAEDEHWGQPDERAPHGVATSYSGPASAGPPMPTTRFQISRSMRQMMLRAVAQGHETAAWFERRHADLRVFRLQTIATDALPPPPTGAAEQRELRQLHRIARTRTRKRTEWALWLGNFSMQPAWEALINQRFGKGTPQAVEAIGLLRTTLALAQAMSHAAKTGFDRRRPFELDPKLRTALHRPHRSPSYPSGHTAAAFAAAGVLSRLIPEWRDRFQDLAVQAGFARMYGGVHFPSDVARGAWLGTIVADFVWAQQAGTAQRAA